MSLSEQSPNRQFIRTAFAALLAVGTLLALAAVPAFAAAPTTVCSAGTDPGQCKLPSSLAVDPTSGTLYLADQGNARIDEFTEAGTFLRAFGWGVLNGAEALQVCTSACQAGHSGPGAGAMQPRSVAVDPAGGDIYVSEAVGQESGGLRVQKFSPSGQFLLMFGGEVDKTTHADVCTAEDIEVKHDVCGAGVRGTAPGFFEFNVSHNVYLPLAVDPAGHEVLVGDLDRVQRFSEAGHQLSEFALPAAGNLVGLAAAPAGGGLYTLEEPVDEVQQLTPPASGTYTLSFEGQTTGSVPFNASPEAVQNALSALPAVGDNVNVISAGGGKLAIGFIGALSEADLPQIVPSAGTVSTTREGSAPKLEKREPSGTPLEALDAAGHPQAFGLDPSAGSLYVSDQRQPGSNSQSPATVLAYGPGGARISAFGNGQVSGAPQGDGLAFGPVAGRLYVANHEAVPSSVVQSFALPAPGPLLREGSLTAVPRPATATLKATITPEGAETSYHFQYVSQKQFEAEGGWAGPNVKTTPVATLPADFTEHEAKAPISGLTSETVYRFRVFAHNENGEGNATGAEEASFETLPPIVIESESAGEVSSTSAELRAELNDLGEPAGYRFEYLTEAAYQQNLAEAAEPFQGSGVVPVPDASLEALEGVQSVSQTATGLTPATVYRYRVFAHDHGGSKAGPALSFTTQAPGAAALPDHRAYELVSPPEKHGALIKFPGGGNPVISSPSGDALTWVANAPTEASPPGFAQFVQVLSRRAGTSTAPWLNEDISTPHTKPAGVTLVANEYRLFSEDLSRALVQPIGPFTPLSPEATETTPYLRTDFPPGDISSPCQSACYRPLVSAANVPEGTEFGGGPHSSAVNLLGASPDASHIVLTATAALVNGAPEDSLYEWSDEQLQLVSVSEAGNAIHTDGFLDELALGSGDKVNGLGHYANPRHAISTDGSRVVFSEEGEQSGHHLYLRDTAAEGGEGATVRLDKVQGGSGAGPVAPIFQDATPDASRIFFTDTQQLLPGASASGADLYECRIVEEEGEAPHCALTDLTGHGTGEPAAVIGILPGASSDGSSLYFVANGRLTSEPGPRGEAAAAGNCSLGNRTEAEAAAERCNLYELRGGAIRLVAVLSGADAPDWGQTPENATEFSTALLTARVSPSGRYLAFSSRLPLTGYDNRDAVSGVPDQEAFLYDVGGNGRAGSLVCASCDPTGARPHGVEFAKIEEGATGSFGVWPRTAWIAGLLPTWSPIRTNSPGLAFYQPRYVSASGRLFFTAPGALVPGDSNGTEDVYEYEPPAGAGEPGSDTCTTSSSTFSPASGGCLSLISSGTSKEESAFMDASESGDDVFFLTSQRLSSRDEDTAADLYDARVGGGEVQAAKPVECSGDACQQPAVPPNDQTPGSLTFQGAGNVTECPKGKQLKAGKCVDKTTKHKKQKKKKQRKSGKKSKRIAKSGGGGHQ